ncbi:MAG: enoyl-CoA hydratase-related protein [Candidatus Binatus sp.]|uniref:enoyl-CoA hydratase-related protein n=1 Tax=Candidatus Binatus sp. TaxID=2811406 RepID=UPI00271972E3|nr:enoyl-CoA hydratase-related protein [Candidatus Binatus sp.]MDO8431164.1 enoyl-CoA hydratase-related protein [Candidatus Binatus sp.]
MAAEQSNVSLEFNDAVAVVRLDRPEKLNAFTFRMIDQIRDAIRRAGADESAVGIVVTGTGRAFSAGLDTTDLARSTSGEEPASDGDASPPADEMPALFSYLLRIPKPVIAAINGVAAGGGFVLAMMCDLRFAAETASFTTAFSKRGLIAEHGTSWILPRLVGPSRALDLLWSSRRIDSAEALRIGFVDRVVPADRVVDEACAYVRDLAANVSPRSIAVIKSQVYRHLSLGMEPAIRDADVSMREALVHPDSTEGVASFVERRPPRFLRLRGEKI